MNLPFTFFRSESAATPAGGPVPHVAPRTDVQWGGPVFRAPALPAPDHLHSALPFTVNSLSKMRAGR